MNEILDIGELKLGNLIYYNDNEIVEVTHLIKHKTNDYEIGILRPLFESYITIIKDISKVKPIKINESIILKIMYINNIHETEDDIYVKIKHLVDLGKIKYVHQIQNIIKYL